jgi:L-asparagine transporter-like permease
MNESLHSILVHLHSVGRWIMLLLLVIAIFNSLVAGDRPFIKSDARTGLILVITADLMFLIGAVLWYLGPWGYSLIQSSGGFAAAMKNPVARFYGVEHLTGMLIAIILIHIGKTQGKKKMIDRKKHMRTVLFYVLALVIILATIPWPFRVVGAGRGWY